MPDPCIDLLARLVSIDSVNPSLVDGAAAETRVAEEIADHLSQNSCKFLFVHDIWLHIFLFLRRFFQRRGFVR